MARHIFHVSRAFVNKDVRIQNLALANNDIADSAEVDWLVPLKLRELLLHDNPIGLPLSTSLILDVCFRHDAHPHL